MEFLTDTLFTEFGRTDYIGSIDNGDIDFGQLDQFIHVATDAESPPTSGSNVGNRNNIDRHGGGGNGQNSGGSNNCPTSSTAPLTITSLTTTSTPQSHLPESPPDSGSEPPYSPADLHGLTIVGPPSVTTPGLQRSVHQQHSPELSTVSLASLSDFSQTSIDLHHNHLSLLNSHHHHHHHQQQQDVKQHQQSQHQHQQHETNASAYMRGENSGEDHLLHSQHPHLVGIGEMTICKHEGMLLHQSESLAVHQQNNHNLLDNYRNDLSHGNLLSIGPGQLCNDDLSRLMPSDVYSATTPVATSSNGIRNCQLTPTESSQMPSSASRKRKLSHPDISGASHVKSEPSASLSPMCQQHLDQSDSPISSALQSLSAPPCTPDAGSNNNMGDGQNPDTTGGGSGGSTNGEPCPLQCIRFSPFQQQNWHVLCNQSLQELPLPYYNVDADKGFNFSNSDDAFVCQKKNHFQITCHAKLHGNAVFVRTSSGLEKIKSFHLHFYGVKLEAPNNTIRIEQSQSDRSKKPFHPVPINLQSDVVSKITVVRLHFSETTSNNMRKKGRPNPEQRYFQLVVGLHAHTHSGHFPIISHGSERIIVRASNPGQFESDVELCWQRGVTADSIFHAGRVGINTDRPDESLVVHGNLKVSGHIVQPSDIRAKQEIGELDTSEQLKNLQKIRIVKYRYEPEFAVHSGLKDEDDQGEIIDTGVIAQEVREVLPDAVQEAGNIVLSNGQVIEKFLLVNKDRILMENIGAVKELCKVTGSLETRIEQLEKINSRLIRIQQLDRKHSCSTPKCKHLLDSDDDESSDEICSNKTIQKIIIILVIIMAMCLLAISALYFVEHRQNYISTGGESAVQTREQIYNSNLKRLYPAGRQYQQHQDTQQLEKVKMRYETNYPLTSGDIPGNDIDDPIGWKIPSLPSLSSPKPKDQKTSPTTMSVTNNKQFPVGSDYDTDNLAIAPVPPGEESSSEKLSETNIANLPLNSFENERTKKIVKGKSKSALSQSNSNTKKPQYQQLAQRLQGPGQKPNLNSRQPIDSKGHADAAGDQDLQYLSNNNDSDDQLPMENSVQINSFVTRNRTVNALTIGTPLLCESVKTETIECQSVCCEESNRLLESIDFADNSRSLNQTSDINERVSSLPNTSTPSLCSTAPALQPNNNNNVDGSPSSLSEKHQHQKQFEVDAIVQGVATILDERHQQSDPSKHEALLDATADQDTLASAVESIATDSRVVDLLVERENTNHSVPNNNVSHDPSPGENCYPVVFYIRSESFNTSAGKENICLNGERRQNIIYTIAISKYMRETKIELHFIGPNSLQWSLCNRRETIAGRTSEADYPNSKASLPSASGNTNNIDENSGIFQISPSKSIFHLHLPNYGYFEKKFELRAGFDLKSICQEQVDDTSNLLQYNIRIFRDCV